MDLKKVFILFFQTPQYFPSKQGDLVLLYLSIIPGIRLLAVIDRELKSNMSLQINEHQDLILIVVASNIT